MLFRQKNPNKFSNTFFVLCHFKDILVFPTTDFREFAEFRYHAHTYSTGLKHVGDNSVPNLNALAYLIKKCYLSAKLKSSVHKWTEHF